MNTITLKKSEYETLRKKASLYEEVFRYIPEKFLKTEDYSKERVKEFFNQDRIDEKSKKHIKKILKSL